jgi:hypothetical protein
MHLLSSLRRVIPAGIAAIILVGFHAPGCARAQEGGRLATMDDPSLPPSGYGTLRQEDVSIRLRTPSVQIQVVPLDEHVIRLLATDTYTSLHRLLESKATEIETVASRNGIRDPGVFLVTFFGLEQEARFNPDDLTIESQNRLFRPLATIPLSPLWSGQQLSQRETATALYVFDGIRLTDPFTVEYVIARNNNWEQILRTLDRERASVLSRASGDQNP